jgi:hypothetical protein
MDYKYKYIKYKTKYLEQKGGYKADIIAASNSDYERMQNENLYSNAYDSYHKMLEGGEKGRWISYFYPYILLPKDIGSASDDTKKYCFMPNEIRNIHKKSVREYNEKHNDFYNNEIRYKYYDLIIDFLRTNNLYNNYYNFTEVINNKINNYNDLRKIFDAERQLSVTSIKGDLYSNKFWRSITDFTRAIIYYNHNTQGDNIFKEKLNSLKTLLCKIINKIVKSKIDYDNNPSPLESK